MRNCSDFQMPHTSIAMYVYLHTRICLEWDFPYAECPKMLKQADFLMPRKTLTEVALMLMSSMIP